VFPLPIEQPLIDCFEEVSMPTSDAAPFTADPDVVARVNDEARG